MRLIAYRLWAHPGEFRPVLRVMPSSEIVADQYARRSICRLQNALELMVIRVLERAMGANEGFNSCTWWGGV